MKLEMHQTQSARDWLQVMGRIYEWSILVPVIEKAEKIAKERQATRLGKLHLELALGMEEE
ncbi:MAG: hypothetical protein ACYTBZ_28965 [Planctomycetota bacterium]|jgi:hypothetical protein